MAFASAFLSSSFTVSASETLKTPSVPFNLGQFAHSLSRNNLHSWKCSNFIFIPQVSFHEKLETSSVGFNLHQSDINARRNRTIMHASANGLKAVGSGSSKSNNGDPDYVPIPMVAIIQDYENDFTKVKLSFGDRLGDPVDMIKALSNLGLNVFKYSVFIEGSVKLITLVIRKLHTDNIVDDPFKLETIRLTIVSNLLKYHPESSEQLAMGALFGVKPKKLVSNTSVVVDVQDDGPKWSLLYVETADRPGLLFEIMDAIAHLNMDINIVPAEIVTEGLLAKHKLHVSYKGKALSLILKLVLKHSLRYFLQKPDTNTDRY